MGIENQNISLKLCNFTNNMAESVNIFPHFLIKFKNKFCLIWYLNFFFFFFSQNSLFLSIYFQGGGVILINSYNSKILFDACRFEWNVVSPYSYYVFLSLYIASIFLSQFIFLIIFNFKSSRLEVLSIYKKIIIKFLSTSAYLRTIKQTL